MPADGARSGAPGRPSPTRPTRPAPTGRPRLHACTRPQRRRVQRSLERFLARPRSARDPRGSGDDRPALRAAQTEPAREPRALAAPRSVRGRGCPAPAGRNAHAAASRPATSSSESGRGRAGELRPAAAGRADAAADTYRWFGDSLPRLRLGNERERRSGRSGTQTADSGPSFRPASRFHLPPEEGAGCQARAGATSPHRAAPAAPSPPGRCLRPRSHHPALSVLPRPPSSPARAPVAADPVWLRTFPGL